MPDSHKQILKKYDPALKHEDSEKYKLSILFSDKGFTFCIFNGNTNKYLSIESHELPKANTIVQVLQQFANLKNEHEWLSLDFQQVNFMNEVNQTALVPAPLFDKNELKAISQLNFTLHDSWEVKYENLNNLDAYILYQVPEMLDNTLEGLYKNYTFNCHISILIESLLIQYKNQPVQKRCFVNVRDAFVDILIMEGRKLHFSNTFNFRTKDDFIYYVIFVLEQLNLNPENIDLYLSGSINRQSGLFELIYKYVRHVKFVKLPESFDYSYVFNEIPAHYYFNLLNLRLCV